MIKRSPRLIIAFYTTHDAMAFEEYCHNNSVSGRLIPLPGEISAGCGLAWSSSPDDEALIRLALSQSEINPEVIREITIPT